MIFLKKKNGRYSYSKYFTQIFRRLTDPQIFKINFICRFGKMDTSLFKRKNMMQDMGRVT